MKEKIERMRDGIKTLRAIATVDADQTRQAARFAAIERLEELSARAIEASRRNDLRGLREVIPELTDVQADLQMLFASEIGGVS